MGAGLGIFLAYLLFIKRHINYANRFLAILLLIIVLQMLGLIVFEIEKFLAFPGMNVFFSTITLLLGPLHFLYAKFLIQTELRFKRKHWFYFAGFLGMNILFLPIYVSGNLNILIIEYRTLMIVQNVFIGLHGISFMILTLIILQQTSKKIKDSYSSIDEINLNWLKRITISVLICLIIVFIHSITVQILHVNMFNPLLMIAIMLTGLIYIAGFLGLKQPEIFLLPIIKKNMKYKTSGLNSEIAESIKQRLLKILEDEKPFLESDLNITKLSDNLSISPSYLSQVINEKLGRNFYDLINFYRIEEAKRRLIDPVYKNLTVLSIAYDVGFNSKSTFNTSFKKYMNLTPSQYLKKYNQN